MLVMFQLPFSSIAQNPEPVFRRYTVDDGLPSSMVYHAFQDSKGYVWFATANGVSRFDGYKFENFDLQSGLVDNDVFEIYEDCKNRIWFIPMSGRLCYYENGRIIPYKFNDLIAKHTQNTRGPFKCSFYVDKNDFIYLSMRFDSRFSISPDGVLRKFVNKDNCGIEAYEISKGKILVSYSGTRFSRKLKFDGLTNKFEIEFSKFFGLSFHPMFTPLHLFFVQSQDSSTFVVLNGSLVKCKGNEFVNQERNGFEKRTFIWLSIDNQNGLWVSESNGGVQLFDSDNIVGEPKMTFLENYKVSSVLNDNEGAYWFTTLNDGVFYCPNINVLKEKSEKFIDNRVNAIMANKDGLYVGYEFAFVDKLDRKGNVKYFKSPIDYNPKNSVRSFLSDTLNSRLWVCSITNLNYIENEKVKVIGFSPDYNYIYPRRMICSKSGGYWIATTRGLIKYENNRITYKSDIDNSFKEVVYDIAEDYENRVWLCTVRGIWTFKDGVFKFMGDVDSSFSQTSYSVISNPLDSSIWVGTNGDGVIVSKGNKLTKITSSEGLISNSIKQLVYKNNNIWVATRMGLSRIVLNGNDYTIKNFTKSSGLLTNEINSISEYNDTVYLGTPVGICFFNKNKIGEFNNPPKIVISKFLVKDKPVDLTQNNLHFDHSNNSFSIDFVGFVFRNEGKVNYRYRMLGIDSSWYYTQTPNCQYTGLVNGKYKFEVQAQSYNGIWSNEPAFVEFTIHPPFWKRIWFLLLIAILFSGLTFLLYRLRVNSIHRRNKLIQNINLYKQQSLRQQMNPHFIFNTLNSIQLYILEKDSISSHKYLTKFARLMRVTLDNSLYPAIPLKDELDALTLYLDLERLRFEDKFEYLIDYGSDKNILNYEIPTLLIQPFVENAIWHGISLRKDQHGWIKIIIKEEVNLLKCIVQDNGVGRAAADKIGLNRKKEHKSRGSQITQERIDLLGQMYKEKFSIVYDDLIDNLGEPLGTRVTITIPKSKK